MSILESGINGIGGVLTLSTLTSVTPLLLLLIDVFRGSQLTHKYSECSTKAMQDDLRVLVDSELETAFLNFKLRMGLVKEHLDNGNLKSAQENLVLSCEYLNRITVMCN